MRKQSRSEASSLMEHQRLGGPDYGEEFHATLSEDGEEIFAECPHCGNETLDENGKCYSCGYREEPE